MTDSLTTTTTSATPSTSRKRPRKRARKSKSKAEDGPTARDVEGDDGEEEETTVEKVKEEPLPSSPSKSAVLPVQPTSAPPKSSSKSKSNDTLPATASTILSSNPHKPSVLPRPSIYGPRKYTLSIALPSSIVLNAQTMELKTRLIGSIARICAVFNVDEIIVFNEGIDQHDLSWAERNGATSTHHSDRSRKRDWQGEESHAGNGERTERDVFDPDSFTAMILQYLETPQYLRKQLFPMHPNLRLAGLLPPLDCPHHLRFEEESPYREGIVVEEPHYTSHRVSESENTVWVNVGSREPMQCRVRGGHKAELPPSGARVTVELPKSGRGLGNLVSPRTPVQAAGLYWGYSVRLASSLSQVFTSCPFLTSSPESAAEYDLVIGTAERGDSLTDLLYATQMGSSVPSSKPSPSAAAAGTGGAGGSVKPLPADGFQHALLLFGGLSGLEVAIERDVGIPLGLEDAHELCDYWVDVVEGQGSRTVRTEEAITIALARLKTTFEQLGRR